MQNLTIALLLLACAFFGLSYCCFQAFSQVPKESRQYRDRLPLGFLLIWPLVLACVYWFGARLSMTKRQQTLQALQRAGADFVLSPEQFLYTKPIGALLMAGLGAWLCTRLTLSMPVGVILAGILGFTWPSSWLHRRRLARTIKLNNALPHYLDLLTLSLEAGLNFAGAIELALSRSPPDPLHEEFTRLQRDFRSGKTKREVLMQFQNRTHTPAMTSFTTTLLQADITGASVSDVLREQAKQRRQERFIAAERKAMEAPVKLLGPLIAFIFPTTFLVLGFLVVAQIYTTQVVSSPILEVVMSKPSTSALLAAMSTPDH